MTVACQRGHRLQSDMSVKGRRTHLPKWAVPQRFPVALSTRLLSSKDRIVLGLFSICAAMPRQNDFFRSPATGIRQTRKKTRGARSEPRDPLEQGIRGSRRQSTGMCALALHLEQRHLWPQSSGSGHTPAHEKDHDKVTTQDAQNRRNHAVTP